MLPSIKSLLNMPSEMDGHHSQHSRKQYHSGTSSSSTRTHHHHYNPDRRPKPYDSHRHTEIPKLPSVNEVLASAQRPTPDPFLSYNYKRESGSSSRDIRSSGESSKKSGYPCERCGRLFTRKSDALKHIRVVHDRLKVYACCVCDRRFARKDYCTVC